MKAKVKSYSPEYLDQIRPLLNGERREYKPSYDKHTEPPVLLDDYGTRVWRGKKFVEKDDKEVDSSASLLLLGRVLYNAGATRTTVVEALKERDASLGWRKYTDRSDSEKQYHAIVDELQRYGRAPTGNTSSPSADGGPSRRSTLGKRIPIGEAIKKGVPDPAELVKDVLLQGKAHQIFSGAGNGKSFLAMWLAKKVIEAGKPVLYLDTENAHRITSERFKALGLDPDEVDKLFHYHNPSLSASAGNEEYLATLDEVKPALVIFDSLINFLAASNLDENVSGDVAKWFVSFAHPARRRDIAVVLLDHVPKDGGGNSRGSGRKKEEVDVQWELVRKKPFNRFTVGSIDLKLHKDREGWLPQKVEFEVGGSEQAFVFRKVNAEKPRRQGLTERRQQVLKVLKESFGTKGAKATEWQESCEKSEHKIGGSTFYEAKKHLSKDGWVNERDGKYFPAALGDG